MPVIALEIRPKIMMDFLPNLSASAPPIIPPIKLEADQTPKIRPTSVIPTSNFWAREKEREGERRKEKREKRKGEEKRKKKRREKEKREEKREKR